jgi:hypothetical protein
VHPPQVAAHIKWRLASGGTPQSGGTPPPSDWNEKKRSNLNTNAWISRWPLFLN